MRESLVRCIRSDAQPFPTVVTTVRLGFTSCGTRFVRILRCVEHRQQPSKYWPDIIATDTANLAEAVPDDGRDDRACRPHIGRPAADTSSLRLWRRTSMVGNERKGRLGPP